MNHDVPGQVSCDVTAEVEGKKTNSTITICPAIGSVAAVSVGDDQLWGVDLVIDYMPGVERIDVMASDELGVVGTGGSVLDLRAAVRLKRVKVPVALDRDPRGATLLRASVRDTEGRVWTRECVWGP